MSRVYQRPVVRAVLGPTNTGKTHYAIDRMLGHASGVFGFPLRLLARENYDRVVAEKGTARVALVTGEEKVIPPRADYFICTVESMPLDRQFDFLAIDEIQMCADAERGHAFTDRLLRARGEAETLFLGSETIRPIIQNLVPNVEFVTRPRLSNLTYVGPRKITRLPRRTAVVTFSINEVYAIAEAMRRQRGGAAVVLGALSPRTRNAQVSMYQEGEVDFLVATDAIGMGLNMKIDHVAFASFRKFDGRNYRRLSTPEFAQIAGRAGRNMSDGTFGPLAEIGDFDEGVAAAIEDHRFDPLTGVYWRNAQLDFRSGRMLRKSLDEPPPRPELIRARDAVDKVALGHLMNDPELADRASTPDVTRLLWDICQIPDFRKTMAEAHATMLSRIFRDLTDGDCLPVDWVAAQIAQLDRVDGDIDTLMARIAHVRTWTYISHRADWLQDAETWQARARQIENKISDALHESLTQRFVDRRVAALARMKERDDIIATVGNDDDVLVGGEFVGYLEGFRFIPDINSPAEGRRALMSAANKALRGEIESRIDALTIAPHTAFSIENDGRLHWNSAVIGCLVKGPNLTSPRVQILSSDCLNVQQRERIAGCLEGWISAQLNDALEDLMNLVHASLNGVARGIAYRVIEGLGSLPRQMVMHEVRELSKEARNTLRGCGIRIGAESLFIPSLIKPKAVQWRSRLWALHMGKSVPSPPAAGLVTVLVADNTPNGYLEACGFCLLGGRAIRVDVLDRLATDLRRQSRAGKIKIGAAQLNLLGLSMKDAHPIFEALGYNAVEKENDRDWKWVGRPRQNRSGDIIDKPKWQTRKHKKALPIDKNSPFAKLQELKLS